MLPAQPAGPPTPAAWATLRFLALANRLSRHAAGLAAYLDADADAARRLLDQLLRQDLIRRTTRDGGKASFQLTDEGRRLLADEPLHAILAAAPDDPTSDDTLTAMLDHRAGIGAASAFGLCRTCHHLRANDNGAFQCWRFHLPLDAAETEQICVFHQTDTDALITAAARKHRRRN